MVATELEMAISHIYHTVIYCQSVKTTIVWDPNKFRVLVLR